MKIKDLITQLMHMPQDAEAVSYELECDAPVPIVKLKIIDNGNQVWLQTDYDDQDAPT